MNLVRMSLALRVTMPGSSNKLQLIFVLGSQDTSLRDHRPSTSVRRQIRTSLTQLKRSFIRNLPRSTHAASWANESANRGFSLDVASAALSPEVSAVRVDSNGFKTATYKKKATIGFLCSKNCKTSSPTSYWCM
jgi:hypothetical protein